MNHYKLLFLVTEDWYFVSHRLHLAQAAIEVGYKVALLTRVSSYRNVIENSGVEVIDWSLDRRSFNPLRELRAVYELVAVLSGFQPDCVHAVALKPVLYTAFGCRLTGINGCVFALGGLGHVFSSSKSKIRLLRFALRLAFRWALGGERSRLILQNLDDIATLVDGRVIEVDRIRLIRGVGVDTMVFHPVSEEIEVPLVVLPARMLWDKGVGEFVFCARVLKKKGVVARFVLVGKPDMHNPECVPVTQLEEWEREKVVEWWGHRDDMPEVLSKAAIVCLPSYREGLPKALVEAASCGLPIVAYDVPGCREVVVDGENGFLVPLKDESGLSAALERLLCDPDLRRQMGAKGREMVVREFSQEKIAAETIQVWAEVLA